MRRARKAFTLIELMVVIAILAILISIVAYGISRVINHTKVAATRVTLQNLRSMVSEFEVTTKGLTRQPGHMYWNNVDYLSKTTSFDIWRDADPSDNLAANNVPEPDPALAPADVQKDTNGSLVMPNNEPNQRYKSDGIANTQLVMQLLRQAPANKSLLGQLPASQLMERVPDTIGDDNDPKLSFIQQRPDPPLVLDAWGNPILFVPAGGLCGVDDVNSAQSMWVGGPPDPGHTKGSKQVKKIPAANNSDETGPIKSPDNRPFWASAGPDGNFCTADDNIYSFEQ